jgi:hypothetical protein
MIYINYLLYKLFSIILLNMSTKKKWDNAFLKIKKNVWTKKSQALKSLKEIGKEHNTSVHRTFRRRSALKTNSSLLSPKNEFLVNPKLFTDIKLLSQPAGSSSSSFVYLLRGKKDYQYILKLTILDENMVGKFNAAYAEAKIYRLMNILVKKQITPHVFQNISVMKEHSIMDLQPGLMSIIRKEVPEEKYSHIYSLLNETGDRNIKIIKLYDFLDIITKNDELDGEEKYDILVNILFQILYTLEVFNRIGVKHNDLHTDNIFVLFRKRNAIKKNEKQFYRKYIFRTEKGELKEVKVANIGIDVRIYDFDRSSKVANNFIYYPKEICSIKMSEFKEFNQTCIPNPKFDTYTILGNIRFFFGLNIDCIHLIDSFFPVKSLIYAGIINGERVEYKSKNKRYYLASRIFKDSEMDSTETILIKLEDELADYGNMPIYETYSMEYLDTSLYNTVITQVKNRQTKINKLKKNKN